MTSMVVRVAASTICSTLFASIRFLTFVVSSSTFLVRSAFFLFISVFCCRILESSLLGGWLFPMLDGVCCVLSVKSSVGTVLPGGPQADGVCLESGGPHD